jgi:hypothetical protein
MRALRRAHKATRARLDYTAYLILIAVITGAHYALRRRRGAVLVAGVAGRIEAAGTG